jgi:hypothetical protein
VEKETENKQHTMELKMHDLTASRIEKLYTKTTSSKHMHYFGVIAPKA